MKKLINLKWLGLIVCALWITQASAQATPCFSENFDPPSMTSGTGSGDCRTGLTSHLRAWSGTNSSGCPGPITLDLSSGHWTNGNRLGVQTGQFHSAPQSLYVVRQGSITLPTFTNPQVITFWAAQPSVPSGTSSHNRGFRILIDGVAQTAAMGTVLANGTPLPQNPTANGAMGYSPNGWIRLGSNNTWVEIRVVLNATTNITMTIETGESNGSSDLYVDDFSATCLIDPTIDLTSGDRDATEMEGTTITPVIFTYAVATAAQVSINWFSDAARTIPTTMPAGLTWTDTGSNTFTLGGTPDIGTAGAYYYRVSVPPISLPAGDYENASITIGRCEANISLTSDPETENQTRKAGFAIDPIVYTFSNIDGVPTINGCNTFPCSFDGLTANYNSNTLTISGSPAVRATHEEYPYTISLSVSAQKLAACDGNTEVNASGTITVRDPNPPTLFIPRCNP